MTKQEFLEMLGENLSLELDTAGCQCGCGDFPRFEIKIKFDGETVCSDYIYLSSLKLKD